MNNLAGPQAEALIAKLLAQPETIHYRGNQFEPGPVPNLYPSFYSENRDSAQPTVTVMLRNEERSPICEQVSDWIGRSGVLANSDLCQIAAVDTLRASKMLKGWVAQGILLRDDAGGKRHTVYRKPNPDGDASADVSLSLPLDNGEEK